MNGDGQLDQIHNEVEPGSGAQKTNNRQVFGQKEDGGNRSCRVGDHGGEAGKDAASNAFKP